MRLQQPASSSSSFSPAAGSCQRADRWRRSTRGGGVPAACAACHGPDGRGAPQTAVGFDVPLPDFTDCSFNSREPSADWFAIGHDGGPVRAFDARMPAFGQALTRPQLEMAVAYIKDFCDDPPGRRAS